MTAKPPTATKPPTSAKPASSAEARSPHERVLRRAAITGVGLIALFGSTLGLWAVTSPFSGAVVAQGQFVVDTNLKKVQHQTGGIVGELKVREGDHVKEGDILIRLDETQTRANLQIIVKQLEEYATRRARLEAERDGKEAVEFPEELLPRMSEPEIAKLVESERRLFSIRRSAREGQRSQLQKRIAQIKDEIKGLKAQQEAKTREAKIIAEELVGVRDLYKKNLIQINRLSALEREAASLEGSRGQLVAQTAQAEGKIAEIELQIIQIDADLRAEVMKELREIQAKVAELSEKKVAAEDQLARVDIRAPRSGFVHQLAVHTVGGVVTAAEPIMYVVPEGDEIHLDAKVSPIDIDQIIMDQRAVIRVLAFNQRTTPEIYGRVTRISPDVTTDKTNNSTYYIVRIGITQEQIDRMGGHKIVPGMNADIFIQTQERTPLEYFMKPLQDQVARAFRER